MKRSTKRALRNAWVRDEDFFIFAGVVCFVSLLVILNLYLG